LITEIVKTSDYVQNEGRNVASIGSDSKTSKHGERNKKKVGLKSPPKGNEKIKYSTWQKLSPEQQAVIRKYRDDHGLPGGNKRNVSAASTASMSAGLSDSDVSRTVEAIEARNSSFTTTSTISSVSSNAGQVFGGRAEATQCRVT
jgi:hypothetical protein